MTNEITDAALKLQKAEAFRQSGQLLKAQSLCEQLVKKYPDYYAALHTLGLILADQGKATSALFYLAQANAYCPNNANTLIALGTVYFQLGARDLAIEILDSASQHTPNDPSLLFTLAETLAEDKEYERSIDAYQKVLQKIPNWVDSSLGLSRAYQAIGKHQASEQILMRLLQQGEMTLPVASGLANLPFLPPESNFAGLLARFSQQEKSLSAMASIRIRYLQYQLYHQEKQYDKAWSLLVSANEAKRKTMVKDCKKNHQWESQSLAVTRESSRLAFNEDFPITSLFILGASRSGKTTIESLLANTPGIKCGYENPITINAIRKTFRQAGLISSTQYALLPEKLEASCRLLYCQELQRRAEGYEVFTNTAPSRIHDVFRIIAMFPKARFLFVKRKKADLISRIYAKEYKSGNFYAYSLKDISNHINWYEQMMDTLHEKYPEQTAIIEYESIVTDPSLLSAPIKKLTGLSPNITQIPPHDINYATPYLSQIEAELTHEIA